MRLLKTTIHPDIASLNKSTFLRNAARAIVLKGDMILMLYTARYHDYTLPGGGVDKEEGLVEGLVRELQEETGAQNIRGIQAFGLYEEFRPWHKDGFEIMHMKSYCYICDIDTKLGVTNYEDYEIRNGMKPVWLNIYDAIKHNQQTLLNSDKKGLSVERETFLLQLIAAELLAEKQQVNAN
ncbi:NUDIX hydrolase [Psychromonas ingrahamii]|nr:NUDIX hydrolase [Psychromonas ingrahamii]